MTTSEHENGSTSNIITDDPIKEQEPNPYVEALVKRHLDNQLSIKAKQLRYPILNIGVAMARMGKSFKEFSSDPEIAITQKAIVAFGHGLYKDGIIKSKPFALLAE